MVERLNSEHNRMHDNKVFFFFNLDCASLLSYFYAHGWGFLLFHWECWAGQTMYICLYTWDIWLKCGHNQTIFLWMNMVMVCYFKGKQTTFVQCNTTEVYLFRLIALTSMLHVLAVLRPSSLQNCEYKKGPLRFLFYLPVFLVLTCLNIA